MVASSNLATLRKASEGDIVAEINAHLAGLNSTINDQRKPAYALHAQLLIQELATREQRRGTNTMVVCTIIITVLTVIILALTGVMTWATLFARNG